MSRHIFAATLVILVLGVPSGNRVHADATKYTIEDLGTPIDGLVPAVTGINASGQVSGYVSADAGLRAVRFTDGAGWVYVPGLESTYSAATAINASGDLTGYELTSAGLLAFRYSDGAGVTAIAPLPGGSFMVGLAIASNGDVVGQGNSTTGMSAWRASPGLPAVQLPTLGGTFAMACGVNDAGQIVGSSTTSAGAQHAYRIEADLTVTDAGAFGGSGGSSTACGIDATGRLGGRSDIGSSSHAFRFDAAPLVDIDTFGSTFSSVDAVSAGVSVGLFISPIDGTSHAFVNTDADGSSDLNDRIPADSGWVLSEATSVNTKGQIAGQGLIGGAPHAFRLTPASKVDVTPPTITSLSATPSSITPPNGAMVPVTVTVTATDDSGATPTCALATLSSPGAPAGDATITGATTAAVRAVGGRTYTLQVSCADAAGNHSSASVNVVVPPDTTPPVIAVLSVSPSSIWPPNGAMVPVTVAVTATDDSGVTPTCALTTISSPGAPAGDATVTGATSGAVRAVGGRTYVLQVSCADAAGNHSSASVNVVVPPDTTPPTITALSASPSAIWPPNGKMVGVTVSVSATDNVDAVPQCALTSVSGAPASDFVLTGPLTVSVRANKDEIYTLGVTCSDQAGNRSNGTVTVVVSKDAPVSPAAKRK
jgi:probable HAF family extracellular repeat protein